MRRTDAPLLRYNCRRHSGFVSPSATKKAPNGRQLLAQGAHRWANVLPKQLPAAFKASSPNCGLRNPSDGCRSLSSRPVDYCWAQQNRGIVPTCIVRPVDGQQLSKVVAILKKRA